MSNRIVVAVRLSLGDLRDMDAHTVDLGEFEASGLTAEDMAAALVELIQAEAGKRRGGRKPGEVEPPITGPDYGIGDEA